MPRALATAVALVAAWLAVAPLEAQQAAAPASVPAASQRPPIARQLAFTPYNPSGIYDVGATVGWTVTPGDTPPTYAYKWTIRRNNAVILKEGKLDLSGGNATIEVVADEPGMIYVAVQAYEVLSASASGAPGDAAKFTGGNTGRNTGFYAVGAAVAPAKIGLSTPRPGDFDAFWDSKLAAQARVPANPVLTPVESDMPGIEMSTFQLDALGSKVHGYVAKPAAEGKFPAVIQLQYAGVYALNAHAVAQRAAQGWLMINVDSHDKLPSDPSGNIPRSYQSVGNTDRETSYFLQMYLRDSRALDYLLTRSDWDGKTLVLTGGSMGGQQSLALAGLRPEKITAVLVCVPAGADSNGDLHGRKAGYPNWPSDNPDVMRTALYFDTVNFAPHIKAPVMAGFGFIDTISPPAGVWSAINQIPSAVETLPMIESEHDNLTPEHSRVCPARTTKILDQLVHGGTFAPKPFARLAAQSQSVQVVDRPDEGRVDVLVDGQLFTSYRYSSSLQKPVLFPIRSATGRTVTRGYPLEPKPGERADHPHHVGHWFNYGDVNGYDFWGHSEATPAADKGKMGTIVHEAVTEAKSGDPGRLSVTAKWMLPDGSTLLREATVFAFSAAPGRRVIDRTTIWTAAGTPVTFGDTKEGAFGIRVARALDHPSQGAELVVAADGKGTEKRADARTPSGRYVGSDGKSGEAVWGTRGPWMGLIGTIDNGPITLAILDHPSNHGHPTYWHARGYGLFAANPIGQQGYDPAQKPSTLTLQPGESVTFRHRILVLDREATPAVLQQEFETFSR